VLVAGLVGGGALVGSRIAGAADAPAAHVAFPDVHKIVTENESVRVVVATFKPGQRDRFHSHPPHTAEYFLTDCSARVYAPDGSFFNADVKAGGAIVYGPIAAHSVENVGTNECKFLVVERK
jgi:quercetin dioxygenase-like cupin family protein